jgi:hypothetical protein
MADEREKAAEAVEQHVRQILAQISALEARRRAQEQASEGRSGNAVEIDREDDRSRGIGGTDRPS